MKHASIFGRIRQGRQDDDGIAMLLVVLAMLVVSAISVLALGSIVSQVGPTAFQKKNARTITGAEAGLQAGLAAIRNSTSLQGTDVLGDRTLLPCWTDHSGNVGQPAGADVPFVSTISYFASDPSNQTETWRASNKLNCGSYGPPITPSFALVQARGTGPALRDKSADVGNRTMETVYSFKLTNTNVSGGLIRFGSSCVAATSGSPTVGSQVNVTTCAPGTEEQLWSFRSDFTIQLTASVNTVSAAGMCLSAAPGGSGTQSVYVTMQICDGGNAKQKWGISDARAFFGHLLGSFSDRWCLSPSGSRLTADKGSCPSALPEPQVGAGAAGTTSENVDGVPLQWVSYKEFGRCLDITDWVVGYGAYPGGRPSEISYPCKQDPMRDSVAAAKVGWNEVFTWQASTKQFYADVKGSSGPWDGTGTKYCMKAPNTSGGYVVFDSACTSSSLNYQWTVNRETQADNSRYTVVDGYGRCLAIGPQNMSYPASYTYSSIIVSTCNGSTGQKWNAPPNLQDSPTKNTQEIKDH